MSTPILIKTVDDLSMVYRALYSISKEEFLATGHSEFLYKRFVKNRIGFVCICATEEDEALFELFMKKADELRGFRIPVTKLRT